MNNKLEVNVTLTRDELILIGCALNHLDYEAFKEEGAPLFKQFEILNMAAHALGIEGVQVELSERDFEKTERNLREKIAAAGHKRLGSMLKELGNV